MSDPNSGHPEASEQRRQPKQSRSVETRNSLLAAAGEVFAEQGYEKTTTHQIAARADVSVGALYRYFADKEAILKEVYRVEMSLLRDRILAEFSSISIEGVDVRALVRVALGRAFAIFAERAELRRVLGEQSRRIPELAAVRQAQEKELYAVVAAILTSVPEVHVDDVEVGSYIVALLCESVIEDFLLYRRQVMEIDETRVLDATADLIVSFLHLQK
jgi:AcrR family transcriptional regulator